MKRSESPGEVVTADTPSAGRRAAAAAGGGVPALRSRSRMANDKLESLSKSVLHPACCRRPASGTSIPPAIRWSFTGPAAAHGESRAGGPDFACRATGNWPRLDPRRSLRSRPARPHSLPGTACRIAACWKSRPTSGGLLVVNRLSVEAYLRGVVALELGAVGEAERAAMEAQAVAARSYVYTRLNDPDRVGGERYDLLATVIDQVYGGVPGETVIGNEAVAATAGQVITFGGRVVNAPYSSLCGGETAEPSEVWRQASMPYLQRVSDRIPGTDRYYCDGSSHFRWSRSFSGSRSSSRQSTGSRDNTRPRRSAWRATHRSG